MPHRLRATCVAVLLAGVSFAAAAPAQTSREAEQKLQRVRSELKSIAQERRKLEGERGAASRQLREADEKVGRTSRSLAETEAAMRREAAALDVGVPIIPTHAVSNSISAASRAMNWPNASSRIPLASERCTSSSPRSRRLSA